MEYVGEVLDKAYELACEAEANSDGDICGIDAFAVAVARNADLDDEDRLILLAHWSKSRHESGGAHWGSSQLRKKLEDAKVYLVGAGTPWRHVDMPTHGEHGVFPYGVLPESLENYANAVASFTGVDRSVSALLGLSVLATLVGRTARVVERPGLTHYPALFTCIVAGTGERKSPVFKAMLKPVEQMTAEWCLSWKVAVERYKTESSFYRSQLKSLEKQSSQGQLSEKEVRDAVARLGAEPVKPQRPRLFTNDATEERLVQLLARSGEFAVMSGEARPVFNQILGRYAGGGMTGESVYLAAISGDTITRDRVKTDEEITIEHPCLNVAVMVQPDKFMEVVSNAQLRDSGALSRILCIWPEPRVGLRMETEESACVPESVAAEYASLCRGIRPDYVCSTQDQLVELSEDAVIARRKYHNRLEFKLGELQDFTDAPDLIAKGCSMAAKIALVLHIAEDPCGWRINPISLTEWERSEMITDWLLDATVKVRRLLQDGLCVLHAARAERWLAATGRKDVCALDLVTRGPMPRPGRIEAPSALRILEEHGIIRANPFLAHGRWEVNPGFLASSKPSAA